MTVTIALILLGIIICIGFSAFFSASEMALSSSSKVRMEHESEAGDKKAKIVLRLISHYDDALSAILIGNNLVNTAASSLASVFVILISGSDMTWVSTIVITVLVIIFGESIPKISAKKSANGFSKFAAPFINVLRIVLMPLIFVVVKLVHAMTFFIKSEEETDKDDSVREFSSIIDMAEDEDVIDEDTSERVHKAIDFSETLALEVMTARVDVTAIDIDTPIKEILEMIGESPFSRFPVYSESIDNIIGILHVNKLYQALADKRTVDINELLLEPVYVYKTMKLPTVLGLLKDARQHLAIVTDEYSGTLGVLSFEDVLEEIVGEIWDESDEIEKEVVKKGQDNYEIDADMTISDLRDLLELGEDDIKCESETVGGLIIETLEHFPISGETVMINDIYFEVLEAEERRVIKVLVKVKNA